MAVARRVAVVLPVLLAVGAVAGCGGGDSTTVRSRSRAMIGTRVDGTPVSSRSLRACIARDGGHRARVRHIDRALGLAVRGAFEIDYQDGMRFSVAVERTSAAADALERQMQGILVDLEVADSSIPDEPPAEMKARAAATVHRTGNVVILYGNPRTDEDGAVAQCLMAAR